MQQPREGPSTPAGLRDAKLLRGLARFRYGLAYRGDLAGTVLAVDVDVIQMYLSPRLRGAGYTALHYAGAGDADHVTENELLSAAALASALGRYILFTLPSHCANRGSMVLMPSHATELLDVYRAQQRSAQEASRRAGDRVNLIAAAAANLQDADVEGLGQSIDEIVALLFGEGNAFDELLRMSELVVTERLVHLERLQVDEGRYLPSPEADPEYQARLAEYAALVRFDPRVFATRRQPRFAGTRAEGQQLRDLEALAALPSLGKQAQIISGAGRMRALARKIELKEIADQKRSAREAGRVIDPLCFLPGLLEQVAGKLDAQYQINRLIGTFDQLLYPVYERVARRSRHESGRTDFEDWIVEVSQGDIVPMSDGTHGAIDLTAEFPLRAAEAWQDLTKVLFAGGGDGALDSAAVRRELAKLQAGTLGIGSDTSLHDKLSELLEARTDQMHQAATPIFLSRLVPAHVPRNAPPLRLADMPHVQQVARQIAKRLSNGQSGEFAALLEAALRDDPRQYARYLLVGMSFTTVGLWKNAEWAFDEACKRAPSQREGGVVTGSEAAYGKAVALRILANQPEDLLKAQECLADAQRRAEWKVGALPRDIRFESEELSQWVVFRWLSSSSALTSPRSAFSFRIVSEKHWSMPIQAIYDLLHEIEATPGETLEPDPLVREYVLQQLLCNFFQAHWLDGFRFSLAHDGQQRRIEVFSPIEGGLPAFPQEQLVEMAILFKEQCIRLQEQSSEVNLPFKSQLAVFVSRLAELEFLAHGTSNRQALRDELVNFAVDKAKVMRIDTVRYEVMQRLAELFGSR